ncbi:MAG: hypothetical protein GC185_01960 [Alphaproteobacteria bacterium]|nr:hypothetical protein [Alphaproteobacteria bacterium]
MNFRKAFKNVAGYFNLQSAKDPRHGFDFTVSPARPAAGIGRRLKNYFDLYSGYKTGDKLAGEIMTLANAEGVSKGWFDSKGMQPGYGFTHSYKDFSISLLGDGEVLLKCDADFADKVAKLPSVSAVKPLGGARTLKTAQPKKDKSADGPGL